MRAGLYSSYAQPGVDAVYAHTASTGLRQQTEGTWGESDPASLALALTDIRRRTDAGNDSLTLDVQLNYWAGTLKVGKNPGPQRIVWGDDDDENRVDTVYVGGDVTVPAGITLRIAEGTEVHFPAHTDVLDGGNDATRSELIIEGTLDAGADSITFRSADTTHPSNNDWYGIHVESGGMADLSGATIRDAYRCVQSHDSPDHTPAPVTMTDATFFSNCGLTVTLSPSPPEVGRPLRATLVDPTGRVAGKWQWQRRMSDTEAWEDITLPSSERSVRQSGSVLPGLSVYTPVVADMGKMLRVKMHYGTGRSCTITRRARRATRWRRGCRMRRC